MADELFEKKQPINIRYRPYIGKALEQRMLPLKLLVLGDFSVGNNPTKSVSDRKALEITQDNFDSRIASLGIKLEFSVPDRLSDEDGARLPVSLQINKLKDFEPDQIVQQIPKLQMLLQKRRVLERMKQQFVNEETFRKQLAQLAADPDAAKAFLESLEQRQLG